MIEMGTSPINPRVTTFTRVPPAMETLRVAAYCRVSTKLEAQQSSLAAQIDYYRTRIERQPGWALAGVYSDDGLSATTTGNRPGFLRMMEDAKAGRIGRILVKSISRFSRRVEDLMESVNTLRKLGVSVYFEQEQISTDTMDNDVLILVHGLFAQNEIQALSDNMKVARRMRAEKGIVQFNKTYGFRCCDKAHWEIDPEEANVVRRIFAEYAAGFSLTKICARLNESGIPSPGGEERWYAKSISQMLHNEKYIGHVLTQKTYVIDPLNHTKVWNRNAQVQQYYIRDHHAPVIQEEIFQQVQLFMAAKDCHRGIQQFPYYGLLTCPFCGAGMVRIKLPKNNRSYAWTCGGKGDSGPRKNRSKCPAYYVMEQYIDQGIRAAFDTLPLKDRVTYHLFGKQALNGWKIHHLIRSLSFDGWNQMRVDWRAGGFAEVPLRYKKHSDFPQTSIEKREEHYIFNGNPVTEHNPPLQAKCVRNCQKAVRNALIINPEANEAQVPMVKMQDEPADAESSLRFSGEKKGV